MPAFGHAEAKIVDRSEVAEALHDMVERKDGHAAPFPGRLRGSLRPYQSYLTDSRVRSGVLAAPA